MIESPASPAPVDRAAVARSLSVARRQVRRSASRLARVARLVHHAFAGTAPRSARGLGELVVDAFEHVIERRGANQLQQGFCFLGTREKRTIQQ